MGEDEGEGVGVDEGEEARALKKEKRESGGRGRGSWGAAVGWVAVLGWIAAVGWVACMVATGEEAAAVATEVMPVAALAPLSASVGQLAQPGGLFGPTQHWENWLEKGKHLRGAQQVVLVPGAQSPNTSVLLAGWWRGQ